MNFNDIISASIPGFVFSTAFFFLSIALTFMLKNKVKEINKEKNINIRMLLIGSYTFVLMFIVLFNLYNVSKRPTEKSIYNSHSDIQKIKEQRVLTQEKNKQLETKNDYKKIEPISDEEYKETMDWRKRNYPTEEKETAN